MDELEPEVPAPASPLPPTMTIALLAQLLLAIHWACLRATEGSWFGGERAQLAFEAVAIAAWSMLAVGAWELGRGLPVRAARGARAAAIGAAGMVLMHLTWAIVGVFAELHPGGLPRLVFQLSVVGWGGALLAVAFGLGRAADGAQRRSPLAWLALALVVVSQTWPGRAQPLCAVLGIRMLTPLLHGVLFGVLGVLALRAQRRAAVPAQSTGEVGFRVMSQALWFRLIAVASVIAVVVLGMPLGMSSASVMVLVMALPMSIVVVALARFGLGALAVAHSGAADVPPRRLVIAAALSWWSGAVLLQQAPWVYAVATRMGDDDLRHRALPLLSVLTTAVPVISSLAILIVAVVARNLANQRGWFGLAHQTSLRIVLFVVFMAASLGLQLVDSAQAQSTIDVLAARLLSSLAAVIAAVTMARMCASTAKELAGSSSLPVARARIAG